MHLTMKVKYMVKKGTDTKDKPIEVMLWDTANKLRGGVEPTEYKHIVLSLIFHKFASDKFEQQRKKLIESGKEKYIEIPDFYNMDNVFFLNEISRWVYLKNKQNNLFFNNKKDSVIRKFRITADDEKLRRSVVVFPWHINKFIKGLKT